MNYDNININDANVNNNNIGNGMFNLIYNDVYKIYDVLVNIVKSNPNFEFVSEEPAVHAVHVKVGKTLFSPGEDITIALEGMGENKTKMYCSSEGQEGAAENFRAKYGTLIQKLLDKINALVPPIVEKEEAPKPNNMVQVGELSRQMGLQPGANPVRQDTPTSLNQVMNNANNNDTASMYDNYQDGNNNISNDPTPVQQQDDYKNEPKPFDYDSLKENESSKHKGNDPLQDLMKNM